MTPVLFTVWAIVFTDKNFTVPANLWEWELGSAMFATQEKASAYAKELNETDAFYVHSVIELHVF